jgi:hypothetical protein
MEWGGSALAPGSGGGTSEGGPSSEGSLLLASAAVSVFAPSVGKGRLGSDL